jgi:hypothetical protein
MAVLSKEKAEDPKLINPAHKMSLKAKVMGISVLPPKLKHDEKATAPSAAESLVEVQVQTIPDNKVFKIQLAPNWYLQQRNFKLNIGELIDIKAFKAKSQNGQENLFALEVTRESAALKLRDDYGRAVWKRFERLKKFER